MRKIIFLDVDGVLNSNWYYKCLEDMHGYDKDIDIEKVKLLKEIVDATGAEIVLSSTWRTLREIDDSSALPMFTHLENMLKKHGMTIIDYTPVLSYNRPAEIKTWLEQKDENYIKNIRFISLDDDFRQVEYDFYGLGKCLVQTSYWQIPGGLQKEHVDKAIKILNGET